MFIIETPTNGEIIREIRTLSNLTLRGLAEKVGCSPAHLHHIEKGTRSLTPDFAERALRACADAIKEKVA